MKVNKKKSTDPDVEFFKKIIYSRHKDLKLYLSMLKRDYSFEQIRKVLNELESHPYVRKYFYGNPFPESLQQLGNTFYTIVCDFGRELEVLSMVLSKFYKEINEFIILREDFQRKLILGDYSNAKNVLHSIEEKFGYSLWLLENRLLIEEYTGGVKANKEYLSYINTKSNETFATTLAYYYSIRSERKISALNYSNKLGTLTSDLKKHVSDYLNFKLGFLGNESQITELADILSFESLFSIIDKYQTFLRALQIVVSVNKNENDTELIVKVLKPLKSKISDRLLSNIYQLLKPEVSIPFTDLNKRVLSVFDLYTNGEYQEVKMLGRELLKELPTEFALYEIYVKANLFLRDKLVTIGDNKDNIQNSILELLHHIYQKNAHTKASLLNLQKMTKLLDGLSFGAQIYSFVKRTNEKKLPPQIERLNFVNTTINNPIHYSVFVNPADAVSFLNHFQEFSNLNLVKFLSNYSSIRNEEDINLLNIKSVAEFRINMYKAESLMNLGLYEKAITLYSIVISLADIPIILYEECLIGMFYCYFHLNQFDKCISLFVKNYLANPNLTIRINYQDLHKKIEGDRFKTANADINLPIFYKITDQDNHLTNVTIRLFLKKYNLQKPQDVVKHIDEIGSERIIFFLRNVCTLEIIKYFIYYNGTKEILSDRLEIYQVLLKVDPTNKEDYTDEIGKIAQELVILEGITQVDESKIYVDETSLINNEFEEIKGNFVRYIEISNLVAQVPLLLVDIINNKQILLNIPLKEHGAEEIERSKLAEDLKFELFKELFYEIRNAFLFNSKYGLDSYLSTRIRHGTLMGQIRSQFQDQKLVTQKDKGTDNYYINEYWNSKLDNLPENQLAEIQAHLSRFSTQVDSLISELKDELIQIKTKPKNGKGLFDYSFPNETLLLLFRIKYKSVEEYNEFIRGILGELWRQTSSNLEIIRAHISSLIKDQFNKCLDELALNLKSLKVNTKEFQELLSNIINCKTNINYEMDKISDWFNIREVAIKDFNVSKAIDTSLEITNKISQGVRISPKKKSVNSVTQIRGEFFVHFFDLIRIFLENIVKYSGLPSEDLFVVITADEEEKFLKLVISNNLDASIDRQQLQDVLQKRFLELDQHNWDMDRIKHETGTGFYKAKKILSSDLLDTNNSFRCELDDGEIIVTIKINLTAIEYEENIVS